jgi:hypothetical protein
MLSVPIPINKDFKLTVKYFPLSLTERPKEFSINVGEFVTLNEIRQKIVDSLPEEQSKQAPFITRVLNKNVIEIMGREKFIKSLLEKGCEIVAYQKNF